MLGPRPLQSIAILCIAALLVNLSGCKHKKRQDAVLTLSGEGTPFVYPLMTRLLTSFGQGSGNVRVLYTLSGASNRVGQQDTQNVDFVVELPSSSLQQRSISSDYLRLPFAAGAVSIIYNLPGLDGSLHISKQVLARIFLGQIKRWNDPAIEAINPDQSLPSLPILVVHTEDDGATKILINYFEAVSPEWKASASPSSAGLAGLSAHGVEDVISQVRHSPGAVSYVELAYADLNYLPKAEIENADGVYISPSAASTSAAVSPFADELASHPETLMIVDPLDHADEAYPIVGIVSLLLPKRGNNKATQAALKSLAQFMIIAGDSTIEAMHYAPMPENVKTDEMVSLGSMDPGGKTVH